MSDRAIVSSLCGKQSSGVPVEVPHLLPLSSILSQEIKRVAKQAAGKVAA